MDARGPQQMFSQERPLRCFEKRHQQGVLALAQRDWVFIETYQSSAAMLEPRAIEGRCRDTSTDTITTASAYNGAAIR
jgi:hypothetical protein